MKFPIYSFKAKWSQIGKHNPKWPNSSKDLPPGRIWNSTSFYKMFKEEQSDTQLNEYINNWWEGYIKVKSKDNFPILEVQDVKLESNYKEHETFVLDWFSHYTFDIGQSDETFLDEFEQFVKRYEHMQNNIESYKKYSNYHCLMGAEDRWRWKSGSEDYHKIPCRCEHCKKQGILRIAH